MPAMEVTRIQPLQPLEEAPFEDLFVGCVSFEERCANVAEHFDRRLKFANAIMFRFESRDKKRRRSINQARLSKALSLHVDRKPTVVWCDRSDAMDGVTQFASYLRSLDLGLLPTITLDVTTFTKQYLLALLHALQETYSDFRLRFAYTRGFYGLGKGKPLTWGVVDIHAIPYFNPILASNNPRLLVLFLGYEPARAMATYREMGAERTLAIVPDPPSHPMNEFRCIISNRRLLNQPDVELMRTSAIDPASTGELLSVILRRFPNHSVLISPLGTKMQAVGICEGLLGKSDPSARLRTQVVYATPVTYNEDYYTTSYDPNPIQAIYRITREAWTAMSPATGHMKSTQASLGDSR